MRKAGSRNLARYQVEIFALTLYNTPKIAHTSDFPADSSFVVGLNMHMGWLRLVGSLKVKVIFAKKPCKIDYILKKRPVILWSLLIVATPYILDLLKYV